ncbi:hypothetical protein [Bradyrhizobium sp. WSM2254]|uniref:hypothetical protein n=1 Tax=Bradyrhizobium sp. WSM2254 TaxID=1188263 RepID=UPI000487DAB2|nr:hypothetical protein [Bradyrhizobium sp. WSM2254]
MGEKWWRPLIWDSRDYVSGGTGSGLSMRDTNGCEPDASISMFAYQTANGRPFKLFPRYNAMFHQNGALACVPTCTPLLDREDHSHPVEVNFSPGNRDLPDFETPSNYSLSLNKMFIRTS